MMTNRYPILALLVAFLLVGCGKKDKRGEDQLVTEKNTPAFLASIPADTPYVMASLEPVPMGPLFQWVQVFDQAMGGMADELEAVLADEYLDPGTKAMFALIAEMKGNFNREGLERLGLSSSPRIAIYGVGPLPVLKMDLADPEKFDAMLLRIEERSGFKRTTEKLGEHTFWSYDAGIDMLVMTVQHRQVIVGVTPRAAAPTFVEYLVGERMPENSLEKDGRLAEIASTWDLERFAVGYVDFERIAQMYVDPRPGLNDDMLRALSPDMPPVSEACKTEVIDIAASAPRIVFGYEDWSAKGATFAAAWEIEGPLAQQLVGAKTAAPLAGSDLAKTAALAVAFGFDVGKLVEVVRNRSVAIRNSPYQCEWFQPMNQVAGEVAMATSSFLPPIVTQIQGGAVVITDVRQRQASAQPASPVNPDDVPAFGSPATMVAEGAVAVVAQDAISLFDFLKSLVPEFAALVAKPDGTPTPLPLVSGMEFLELPQVALTPQMLIVTSGEGTSDDIARRAQPGANTPFLTIAWDYQKIWKFLGTSNELPAFGKLVGRASIELDPRPNGVHLRATLPLETTPEPATP